MAEAFQLRIVTPRALLLDERVREVTAPGTAGEFGVLPDHVAFLTALEVGTLGYRAEGGVRRVAVRGGFAEVLDNVMTVLAADAVVADGIDAAAVQAEVDAAAGQLKTLDPASEAWVAADRARRWGLARLEAAGGR